ncbi:MAG: NAD(P)/FAD-dependent oxidoreductase [Syntrophomonadaceae bacterium]|jgi:thioredoxin reductase (NADPH)
MMKYDLYDLAILGCGPAGLSAAINGSIRNKKVIVIGAEVCSPPLHKAQTINNYLGLPGIAGGELLARFMEHACSMNIEITSTKAEAIFENDEIFHILTRDGEIKSKTLIIATGMPYRPTLPDEDRFLGRGLGYCATCDGPLYQGKDVLIIGHRPEAESEASFMGEICRQVYYLPLYQLGNRLDDRINVVTARPRAIVGEETVTGVELDNGRIIQVEGLFILEAETAPERLVPGLEIEDNHIKVNTQQETNLRGVYAAGDCTGPPYQVAKSAGQGQVAGLNASKYASRI